MGPVEVLVSNAGVTDDKLLLQMDEDAFAGVVDTNLTGAFRVVRRATPKMIRARKGRIILISSVVALTGSAGQSNYAASKAGMIGFARSLAREIGRRNITVNVVAPGFVTTDMTSALLSEARQADIVATVPLARMAAPEEIAAAVRFLASRRRRLHHRRGDPRRRRAGDGPLTPRASLCPAPRTSWPTGRRSSSSTRSPRWSRPSRPAVCGA